MLTIPRQGLLRVRRSQPPIPRTHDLINMSKICLPLLDLQRVPEESTHKDQLESTASTVTRFDGNFLNIMTNRASAGFLPELVADANTAARAAIHVQSALRRDYDLLID